MTTQPAAPEAAPEVVVVDPTIAAALAGVGSGIDALVSVSPARLGEGDLAALVVAVEVAARRLVAVQCRAVTDAGGRGLPAAAGAKTAGGWLRGLVNGALLCGRHHRHVHTLNLRGTIINAVIT